mmetsp:Transcript_34964/g.112275  ORF Transcript_34964/g.112275 Transcript_34964/m.112275 type:complete len:693 (+) Transcript_34964:792-2870(+)
MGDAPRRLCAVRRGVGRVAEQGHRPRPLAAHLGRGCEPAPHARVPLLPLPQHARRAVGCAAAHASPPAVGLVPISRRGAAVPQGPRRGEADGRAWQAARPHEQGELRRLQRVLLAAAVPAVLVLRARGGAGPLASLRLGPGLVEPRALRFRLRGTRAARAGAAAAAAAHRLLPCLQAVRGAPFVAPPDPLLLARALLPHRRPPLPPRPLLPRGPHRTRARRRAAAGPARLPHHSLRHEPGRRLARRFHAARRPPPSALRRPLPLRPRRRQGRRRRRPRRRVPSAHDGCAAREAARAPLRVGEHRPRRPDAVPRRSSRIRAALAHRAARQLRAMRLVARPLLARPAQVSRRPARAAQQAVRRARRPRAGRRRGRVRPRARVRHLLVHAALLQALLLVRLPAAPARAADARRVDPGPLFLVAGARLGRCAQRDRRRTALGACGADVLARPADLVHTVAGRVRHDQRLDAAHRRGARLCHAARALLRRVGRLQPQGPLKRDAPRLARVRPSQRTAAARHKVARRRRRHRASAPAGRLARRLALGGGVRARGRRRGERAAALLCRGVERHHRRPAQGGPRLRARARAARLQRVARLRLLVLRLPARLRHRRQTRRGFPLRPAGVGRGSIPAAAQALADRALARGLHRRGPAGAVRPARVCRAVELAPLHPARAEARGRHRLRRAGATPPPDAPHPP